jgi:hypothetical protein
MEDKIKAIKALHEVWRIGEDDAAEDASNRIMEALPELLAKLERLEALVRDMIENEPDDLVADGGHTVLDLWRHDARAALKGT